MLKTHKDFSNTLFAKRRREEETVILTGKMSKSSFNYLNSIRPFQLLFVVALLLTGIFNLQAQNAPSLIPVPVSLKSGNGSFVLTGSTVISIPANQEEVKKIVTYFVSKTQPATGFNFKINESSASQGIQLVLNRKANDEIGTEGYNLESTPENVTISANTPAGLFYGVQTLLQLLPKEIEGNTLASNVEWKIPAVSITDYPRFGWRGIMLDVSRHFFPKEYIKEYIDQLARYKYNRFHWHLTDDEGWRLEIKSLPKLTEVGAWRVPRSGAWGNHEAPKPGEKATDGGFYTQEDVKEIIQYAKDRYIEILPEIDVPGHSMAAIAAYPELSVTNDTSITVNPGSKFSTWYGNGKFVMHIDNTLNPSEEIVYQFLDKVFTEVAALFPYEYIHMGGDECYKGYWEKDPGCQALMKKMKMKDVVELQSYFSKRVSDIIKSKGKKVIGWDEILEGGLPKGAAVMSWRGTKGGIEAAHQKAKVVMSPAPTLYLDMVQGENSVEAPVYSKSRLTDVYSFDPIPEGIDSTLILGGQGNLWTEQIQTSPQIEYMTYPRAFAISEIFWSPKPKKDWNSFTERVETHFDRFDEAKINYARSMYDPDVKVSKNKEGRLVVELVPEIEGLDMYYTIDNTIPNQYYSKYEAPVVFPKEGVEQFRVITYKDGKPVGRLISIETKDLEKRVKKEKK